MNHTFDIEFAIKYGIEEAILIQFIDYWIAQNKAKGINFKNGKCWTYNSINSLLKFFPYLTERKLRRAISKLEIMKVITIAYYSEKQHNRTRWFTFTDSFLNEYKSKLISYHIQEEKINEITEILKRDTETFNPDKDLLKEIKYRQKQEKRNAGIKIMYAEDVFMYEKEYQKLIEEYGKEAVEWFINKLNNYKLATGKKYKSDYRAILNWVVNEYYKTNPKKKEADFFDKYKTKGGKSEKQNN